MKLADVTTVEHIGSADFGRVVLLTQANNEAGFRMQGNHLGTLEMIRLNDDGRKVLTLETPKGALEAFVEESWAVIFPTKAHPLNKIG